MHAPETGTIDRWAWDFVVATTLDAKLDPPRPPSRFGLEPKAIRLLAPGRPPELRVVTKAPKTRGLASPHGRARALHTFFHHELQAAELMAWAVLAFPETPDAFREGLVRIALDEVRHMRMYRSAIAALGFAIGDFAVRDWFWERVPSCPDPASFVAVMGLGFEGGNLEHAAAFARRFREAGDEAGARVQEVVQREEIAHVRFGAHWFAHFTGGLDFERWRAALPAPLSPMLMRGRPLDRVARTSAGLSPEFLDALERWEPVPPSS